jgi:hypothetical protein
MNNEEQKLVGYIIYDIWTYQTSSDRGETWQTQAIIPEVHWKHKIYLTLCCFLCFQYYLFCLLNKIFF